MKDDLKWREHWKSGPAPRINETLDLQVSDGKTVIRVDCFVGHYNAVTGVRELTFRGNERYACEVPENWIKWWRPYPCEPPEQP